MVLTLNVVILAVPVEDDAVAQYMTKLSALGFCVEKFSDTDILIKNYPLPTGWKAETTDLLLHVPPDTATAIHGIQIPQNLAPADGSKFTASAAKDYYAPGWILLSFRLRQDLHNDHFLQNHMELVGQVLAFKPVVK